MQISHSIEKLALAIASPRGGIYFALFERISTGGGARMDGAWVPHWFGDARSCMDVVIRRSALCVAGELKDGAGWTTPEAYVSGWRTALAFPFALAVARRDLRLSPRQIPMIDGVDISTQGDSVLASVDIERHPEALAELLATSAVTPFEALGADPVGTLPCTLGYSVPETTWPLPAFSVWRAKPKAGALAYYWLDDGSGLAPMGWDTSLLKELIIRYATTAEAILPGSAEDAIVQIRGRLKSAREFALEQRVVIHSAAVEPGKPMGALARLVDSIGGGGATIVTTMHELSATDAVAHLAGLPREAVGFPGLPGTS